MSPFSCSLVVPQHTGSAVRCRRQRVLAPPTCRQLWQEGPLREQRPRGGDPSPAGAGEGAPHSRRTPRRISRLLRTTHDPANPKADVVWHADQSGGLWEHVSQQPAHQTWMSIKGNVGCALAWLLSLKEVNVTDIMRVTWISEKKNSVLILKEGTALKSSH